MLLLLLIGGGILYFLAVYRLPASIKFIINKESKGRLAFESGEAVLSLRHKSIVLKNAVLYSTDSLYADRSFTVRIPTIYLSLTSWKELFFHQKLLADSLAIIDPDVDIHIRKTVARPDSAAFHTADILNYLQHALSHFNVRSFSLKNAAFRFETPDNPIPFRITDINVAVSDFTVVNNEDSHLLGSDKVSILLGKQSWVMPGGRQTIAFSQLSFDSKGQRFELDSFSFFQKATTGKGTINLHAGKFFFTSHHLPAIYQKEELLLDTVTCIDPVLSVPGYNSNPQQDTAQKVAFHSNLFHFINIKYADIINGELLLEDKEGHNRGAMTRKANLIVYNLKVNPADTLPLNTDSIRIDMKQTVFRTKDSLYQLSIGEFSFHGKDALFKNVRFEPVEPIRNRKVEFTAPSLLLKNISLIDLLRKHLTASAAELQHPAILLTENPDAARSPLPNTASIKKLELFYHTLHHISELINTPDFYVVDGTAQYTLTGIHPMTASIENLNAHILLNKFFSIDSLVDIKQTIPDWRIGQLLLTTKDANIRVEHYRFDGPAQQSRGDKLDISTTAGFHLTGDDIYWNIFDWGQFQQNRSVRIDSLYLGRLTVHLPPATTPQPDATQPAAYTGPGATPAAPGDLPPLQINRLRVGEIQFDGGRPTAPIHFTIDNLRATGVRSIHQFLAWDHLNMRAHDISIASPKTTATIGQVNFDSDQRTALKDLHVQSATAAGKITLALPNLRLAVALHSTDFSQLHLDTLSADKLSLAYTAAPGKDSMEIHAEGRLYGRNGLLFSHGPDWIRFDELNLDLSALTLHRRQLDVSMAGSFRLDTLNWPRTGKIRWQPLLASLTWTKGSFLYKDQKTTASVSNCSWDPARRQLQLRKVSITPIATRDDAFRRAGYQSDYITLKGETLTLTGIQFPSAADSSLTVHQVLVEDAAVTAARDRRLPFRHGIERPMPTRLISTIPISLHIDTLWVKNSSVTYDECSAATHHWSSVPIGNINGCLLHIDSRNNRQDTLALDASARLFDGYIRRFNYRESYGDSLSGFTARADFSPLDLTQFSQVSIPAAGVSVTSGHADTIYSDWQGNRYATYGTMNLYYERLKVKILADSLKHGFISTLETWAANIILPNSRKRPSTIFLERDREKFVFNYWVKAQTSGVLSTVGVRHDAAYRRRYRKIYKQYSLPASPPE